MQTHRMAPGMHEEQNKILCIIINVLTNKPTENRSRGKPR